jgi:5'-nucleotidase
MNPGGLRADLLPAADGTVRYENLFAVQPFANNLVTLTLSGEQLRLAIESQLRGSRPRVPLVSRGFGFAWDAAQPEGRRVVPGSMKLDGRVVQPGDRVRVTVNSFMASGGDGYSVLGQGTERQTGVMDVDAFEAYVKAHPGLSPGALDRVVRLN